MKRIFDFVAVFLGLLALTPLFFLLVVLIRLESEGPAFFLQKRVGLNGREFDLIKFRSMRVNAHELGPAITVGKDPRITRLGHFLRHWKLDELPQLINVLKGDMSLVGPRPEVPKYVELYPPQIREKILSVRPGITDPASIHFRNESDVLGRSADPEVTYVKEILPLKLLLASEYVDGRSFFGDIFVIYRTFLAISK